ncbi:hypothetical protein DXG01_009276 [Tephrocybe rancida]|nr:hypothetical protein DXG01_009276 [Tephrocybe rancida]
MPGQSTRSNTKVNDTALPANGKLPAGLQPKKKAASHKSNKRQAPSPVKEPEEEGNTQGLTDMSVVPVKPKAHTCKALSVIEQCDEEPDDSQVVPERPRPCKKGPTAENLDLDNDENFMLSSCRGLQAPKHRVPRATGKKDHEPSLENAPPPLRRSQTPDQAAPWRSASPPWDAPPSPCRSPTPDCKSPCHSVSPQEEPRSLLHLPTPDRESPHRSVSPSQDKPPFPYKSKDDSGSDFKKTTEEAQCQVARLSPSRCPLTMEEQDVEYDEEFGADLEVESSAQQPSKSSKCKPKGNSHAADIDGENDANGDSGKVHYKPGPLPEAAKDAMDVLHTQYVLGTQQLAIQYNKSPSSLFQHVGQGLAAPQYQMSGWNAFQIHYNVNSDLSRLEHSES